MRTSIFAAGALLFLIISTSKAQVQYSVGNFLRYGNGEQVVQGEKNRLEYLENQTNVRLFWSNFTIGLQYLYDDPPEFGPRYQGMRKRYVEFAREGVELLAGDFFTLFGKGLAMNLFENRAINYDTGLDGLRGIYRNSYVNAIIATGTMKYYDLEDPTRIESYSVKSAHAEITPIRAVRIGGSFVGADGELPRLSDLEIAHVRADIPEIMFSLRGFGFDLYAAYAQKRSSGTRPPSGGITESFSHSGEGIYGSLSYTGEEGFGITFEYKDYKFDPVDPDIRTERDRPTRMLPMQNPPIVHKEHSFNLLTRNPHVIDFNDEIGMQVDAFYSVTPEITLNVNASAASRQKSYSLLPNGRWQTIERQNAILPSIDAQFSPFYEVYTEIEWYYSDQSYFRAAFNRRYDAPYEEFAKIAHVISSTTFPLRIEHVLDQEYSIGASFEQQYYHDSAVKKNPSYFNQYVSLTLAKAPDWAATIRMEYTTDKADPSGKDFWRAVEFTYRLGNAHTATLTYGTERGGLVCSSGVCRIVSPFDGIRFSLLTQL